ncbi:MAG: hypothetical protein A2513_04040 [Sulfurimonas sp. RIFOXYD12_FULL_33_39]|uniref:endonuclease/exonuclease/phosphatase family protein n=1 Tax=unclassified Sulfurimonas TaxID=2623549 RepID=UPI0008B1D59F|nr:MULTISPECIES: endonuclease/exonuclease/phosphatase family protein [unclassified Sulfurimonas]OHE05045.1 MAG: hypothetical protein A3G74_05395 [Sulfurimonas sp. RIFCSPLOWO2_12_FULL_34_6]OHE09308.1 MAG: hypothetical protein A2513_04040 [Sulfurimonas sp. RIFOXYD12_FULL_33_39]OHE12909.1 MAG: hypothetical protein A2530_04765 [Sulfurimonas sp. RIFOXYD2_FULL_34_21]
MFKPQNLIKSLQHQDIKLQNEFSILCWNVAKLTLKSSYKNFIDLLIKNYDFDILLLQEVKKSISIEFDLSNYSYILSPNIQTKRHVFGVLSAFKTSCESELSLLTKKQELKYATHKVSLITHHKVSNDKTILMVNLHAINFVNNSDFRNELNYIYTAIKSHEGAMIVAGDFNTWNLKRVQFLKEFTEALSLKKVEFEDDKNLKKIFSNSIDYIFYRDLELTYSEVINSKNISDHNPIIAKFRY